MKLDNFEKAKVIVDELNEYDKLKKILSSNNRSLVHFEIHKHYNVSEEDTDGRVYIDKKHTKRFLDLLDEIISELNRELEVL